LTVGASCEITGFVLNRLKSLKWGMSKTYSIDILENYQASLGCEDVLPHPCDTDEDCPDQVIIFNCGINILKASLAIDEDELTFSFEVGDIVGGLSPFEYEWEYDVTHFNASSPTNQQELVLQLKPGKILETLVSKITMHVTDANGCQDTKVAWLKDGELIWWNYEGCPNPANLVVTPKFTSCPAPSNLIVKKKQ